MLLFSDCVRMQLLLLLLPLVGCAMLINAVVFRLCEDAAVAAVASDGVRDVDKCCCFQTVWGCSCCCCCCPSWWGASWAAHSQRISFRPSPHTSPAASSTIGTSSCSVLHFLSVCFVKWEISLWIWNDMSPFGSGLFFSLFQIRYRYPLNQAN